MCAGTVTKKTTEHMSTRATYGIEEEVFYIHHDGYPEGAVSKFQAMLTNFFLKREDYEGKTEYVPRRKLVHGFIAGLPEAEESAHDRHGDTEFQYNLRWMEQGSFNYKYFPKEANENPRGTPQGKDLPELMARREYEVKRLFLEVKQVAYKCKECNCEMERYFKTFFNGPLAVFMDMFQTSEYDGKTTTYADEHVSVWLKVNKYLRNKQSPMWTEYLLPVGIVIEMMEANDGEGPRMKYRNISFTKEMLEKAIDGWMPWHAHSSISTEHGYITLWT
jgi:hypothetical protein